MNLGKFMAFANASNITQVKDKTFSEGKIDKITLMNTFKKVSEGTREINFQIFFSIITQLKKIDSQLYERLGVGEIGAKGKCKL